MDRDDREIIPIFMKHHLIVEAQYFASQTIVK